MTHTTNVENYYLFSIAPTINGELPPSVKLRIPDTPMTIVDFEETCRGMNIIAWARFAELLRKCSTHPEFNTWCKQLGLELVVEDRHP